jgi:hypothetical protein
MAQSICIKIGDNPGESNGVTGRRVGKSHARVKSTCCRGTGASQSASQASRDPGRGTGTADVKDLTIHQVRGLRLAHPHSGVLQGAAIRRGGRPHRVQGQRGRCESLLSRSR